MKSSMTQLGISKEEKLEYILRLSDNLTLLRAKLGFTQESVSSYIGVSRQTYYAIENKKRIMSWGTFLALLFIFDNSSETHSLLRYLDIYPEKLAKSLNALTRLDDRLSYKEYARMNEMLVSLDDTGFINVKRALVNEYERCEQDKNTYQK